MMKIHIMNLLHDVPNGDFPPPQSEANMRCCSAKVDSIEFSIKTATTVRIDKSRLHPSHANKSQPTSAVHDEKRSDGCAAPLSGRHRVGKTRRVDVTHGDR